MKKEKAVIDHGWKPWLWPAPQSGANHIPEGPVGASMPAGLGARASRALNPTTTATCVLRKLRDPQPTEACLQRHDPVAKRRCVAIHASARETRALPGPGLHSINSQKHHAGPAEPFGVARPEAVGLCALKGNQIARQGLDFLFFDSSSRSRFCVRRR